MIILHSDQIMPVGKYKGIKISDIIEKDPDYLKNGGWCKGNKYAVADEVIHKAYGRGTTNR